MKSSYFGKVQAQAAWIKIMKIIPIRETLVAVIDAVKKQTGRIRCSCGGLPVYDIFNYNDFKLH